VEVVLAYSKQSYLLERLRRTLRAVQTDQRSANEASPNAVKSFKIIQRLRQSEIEALLAAYRAGTPSPQLARQYGIGESSVITLLDTHGVPKRRRLVTPEVARQAIKLYGQGQTLAEVGERLGYNSVTVLNILKRAGIPRRASHGRQR